MISPALRGGLVDYFFQLTALQKTAVIYKEEMNNYFISKVADSPGFSLRHAKTEYSLFFKKVNQELILKGEAPAKMVGEDIENLLARIKGHRKAQEKPRKEDIMF